MNSLKKTNYKMYLTITLKALYVLGVFLNVIDNYEKTSYT